MFSKGGTPHGGRARMRPSVCLFEFTFFALLFILSAWDRFPLMRFVASYRPRWRKTWAAATSLRRRQCLKTQLPGRAWSRANRWSLPDWLSRRRRFANFHRTLKLFTLPKTVNEFREDSNPCAWKV